jgi:hypothetical protein
MELDLVWDIRLDLLLEIVDKCWTEKQEMMMTIRIERAAKHSLWREFEVSQEKSDIYLKLNIFFFSGHTEGCLSAPPNILQRSDVQSLFGTCLHLPEEQGGAPCSTQGDRGDPRQAPQLCQELWPSRMILTCRRLDCARCLLT